LKLQEIRLFHCKNMQECVQNRVDYMTSTRSRQIFLSALTGRKRKRNFSRQASGPSEWSRRGSSWRIAACQRRYSLDPRERRI